MEAYFSISCYIYICVESAQILVSDEKLELYFQGGAVTAMCTTEILDDRRPS